MGANVRFGTDGWRGRTGFDFTFATLRAVAGATAAHFMERGLRRAVIGYDRRFLSGSFALHAAGALSAHGVEILLSAGDVPTPALSWGVASRPGTFGVMITASHNPPEYNGWKIKAEDGASLEDDSARDIEARLESGRPDAEKECVTPSCPLTDLVPTYLAALRDRVDVEALRSRAWTVVVDSMHGCGGSLLEGLLAGGRATVITLRGSRDVLFGGAPPEPSPANLYRAARVVQDSSAAACLATDGDADRIGALDEEGGFVGSQILTPLLALHLVENRGARGALAKTFAHTLLLDRVADDLGLRLHVRPIGFKHLAALMRSETIVACGEESGGIGVTGFIPERDGLLAGLLVLEALASRGQTLGEAAADLRRRYGDFHFRRVDLRCEPRSGARAVEALAEAAPAHIGAHKVSSIDRLDGLKCLLGGEGWILFRQSGTEPVLRIYAEVLGRHNLEPLLEAGLRAITPRLPEPPARLRASPG